MTQRRAQELFAVWVERHVAQGERVPATELSAGDDDTTVELERLIADYDAVERLLAGATEASTPATPADALPHFEGFRTIERLGAGGSGAVYKLEDLTLGRQVAAKVLHGDDPLRQGLDGFLREARSLALFEDARIVRVFEFRAESDPPVILMEFVDGFPLNRIGPSLEYRQRARLASEISDAVHHAHQLGIQHRDLKPENVLVDANLRPRILDFGLSRGEPDCGHGVGTPAYMAPEQLDPAAPIDARSDVYALGVMLYELLCGTLPYHATSREGWIDAIRRGEPRLPSEIRPDCPEPLQAIALRAMELEPERRYATSEELADDLRRWLDGKPVTARPSVYRNALTRRVQPHLEQIREWVRLKLLWPHEAAALEQQYERLEVREAEWILRSRGLSMSQIALYLGAVVLFCGALLYYVAHLTGAVEGLAGPTLVLALPFLGLNLWAYRLYQDEREPVAMALHLAAVILLPLFVLAALEVLRLWPASGAETEFFADLVSNHRLVLVTGITAAWTCWLAFWTCTMTFSAYTLLCVGAFYCALLSEAGLALWLDAARYDAVGGRLLLLALLFIGAGLLTARFERRWFARPTYVAAALTLAAALELLALDGRMLGWLGITLAPLATRAVSSPTLLDTCVAMCFNGMLFYALGRAAERHGGPAMSSAAWLLCTVSPFAILTPIARLSASGDYALRFTWAYLGLALGIALLSRRRQRKAFYYAGLLNTAIALFYLTREYDWWEQPNWALGVVAAGLMLLVCGYLFHRNEQP